MGSRSSSALVLVALLTASLGAQAPAPDPRAQAEAASRRAAERIRTLQKESDALVSQERSLLVDLRKLEIERELKTAELTRIDADLAATDAQLQQTIARAAALRETANAQRPDVESRLVQMYKMGHAGYWRMLLAVDDLRAVGRVYRTAAAISRIDRDRVQRHAQTLQQLAAERTSLEGKAAEITRLQQKAAAARLAIEHAVSARNALIDSIDARRDLNAQLAGELEAAATKLQATVAQLGSGAAANIALPIRPFRGALAWPVPGFVVSRFGKERSSRFGTAIPRSGVDISIADGTPVRGVHEGTVAYADQFTGYGNLVILDHGDGVYSLYGYLSSLAVRKGDRVEAQGVVGESGRNPSGNPSLYFELRVDGKPVDPLQWLKKQP